MWLLYAPPNKFGNLYSGAAPYHDDVRFFSNVALCTKQYWARFHKEKGCLDVTPRYLKRIRKTRKLNHILIVATGGIGDTLWNMPFAMELRRIYPHSVIVVLASERSIDVWRYCPFVNGATKDLTWNLFGLFKKSDEVFYFGGVATALKQYTKIDPVEAIFRIAEFDLPKDPNKMLPVITLTLQEGEKAEHILRRNNIDVKNDTIVSFSIHSSTPNRDLPYEHIKQLTLLLKEKGIKVIWLGTKGPKDKWNLPEAEREIPSLNLVGDTSLRESVAIICISNLFIGPNSGLMVCAQAVRTPTIGLFGAFDPHYRAKYYQRFTGIYRKMDCAPCDEHWTECRHGTPAPCMKALTPEIILPHILRMLEKYPRSYLQRGAYQ